MNNQMPLQMQHDYAACGLYYILPLLFVIIWIIAFLDVIGSEFKEKKDKYLWVALVAIVSPIGVPLYFFVGRHKKKSRERISSAG
jgi:heme/copper-type cytochrome/quinol oxidase subunit 4